MSGRSSALARLWAHETRRNGRRLRMTLDERAWIRGREVEVVRWMNQVDRAVAQARSAAEREAA